MRPRFRFVGRLGVADAVTVANAAIGGLAALAATVDPVLAARLLLLGAIADGLDGVLARHFGGTPAGKHLDSLADVATFGVAPAVLVGVVARDAWPLAAFPLRGALAVAVPALFVAAAVTRLGLYTAYDSDDDETRGVPSTLATTVIAAGVLTGATGAAPLTGLAGVMAVLMLTDIVYPDLHAQDALVMGVVQALAVLAPGMFGRGFAFALLYLALAYLLFGPTLYWRRSRSERPGDAPAGPGSGSGPGTGGDGGS
ncbi:MAG: protein sorting system archaetidylserine synthase [Halolamina sp.]